MPTPTPENDATSKTAPSAEAKAKPATSARDAQIASVFDSCIPGGMITPAAIPERSAISLNGPAR